MDAATSWKQFKSLYHSSYLNRLTVLPWNEVVFRNLVLFSKIFTIKFDKTHFIKDIMEEKFVLVTGPDFILPSIYVNMIKNFVKNTVYISASGEAIDRFKTKALFKNSNIRKHEEFFNRNCERHPVIHVCFQSMWNQSDKDILLSFKECLWKAFAEHYHLLSSNKLNDEDNDLLQKYLRTNSRVQYLTEEDIENGLKVLTNILYKQFEKEVFIIIEHYEAPVLNSFTGNTDTQRCIKIIRNLYLNTFSKNNHVGYALLTGVCHITDLGIPTINTSKIYNLLQKRSLSLDYQKEKSDIGRCFIVHDFFEDDKYRDFFSFNSCERKFWLERSGVIFRRKKNMLEPPYLFPLQHMLTSTVLDRLFKGSVMEVTFINDITTDHLGRLKKCLMCNSETDETFIEQTHLFLQLLCNMGYLNCTRNSVLSGNYCVSV